jgi:hypothetical protein
MPNPPKTPLLERISQSNRAVVQCVQRELTRAGLLPAPVPDDWSLDRICGSTWFDEAEHKRPAQVATAGLWVQALSNHFLLSLMINGWGRAGHAAHDAFVQARAIPTHSDLPLVPDLDLVAEYDPEVYFLFELREAKLELKDIADVVGEIPVESGWQRVQSRLKYHKTLPRFGELNRELLGMRNSR